MARPRPGDIFEISTPRGLAYAQVTHHHPQYGALIRVLPGLFDARPASFDDLSGRPERFRAFFPLQAAVSRGLVTLVAHAPIPAGAQAFPTFRAGVVDPATGKVAVWWFWDGQREWRAGPLTDADRRMPIRGVWNDTLLVERIVSGWTPETDPT